MPDYDGVAAEDDQRYVVDAYTGTRDCILNWLFGLEFPRVLEVGCGTGKWLELLAAHGCAASGVDRSAEMLLRAEALVDRTGVELKQGTAEALPWPAETFDAVLFVNALHHVRDPRLALREAYRVLRPQGRFLSIGLDPHARKGSWFVYDYFPETLEIDRSRYPSRDRRGSWLLAAGFDEVQVSIAEHLHAKRTYEQARQQGILEPTYTSQLSLLPPAAYDAGITRLRAAAGGDPSFELEADLYLFATTARKT